MFLTGQFQLKVGLFEESQASSATATTLLEELKTEFGDDYGIVATKFYLQAANVDFITGNWETARTNALKGLEIVETCNPPEADIKRAMHNTKRDLLNVKIRTTAKLDSMDPWNLRVEEAAKNNLSSTLLPLEDAEEEARARRGSAAGSNVGQQLQALGYGGVDNSGVPSAGLDPAKGGDDSDEEEEAFELGTAAVIFGSVTAIAAGITYMLVNKTD